MKHISLKRLLLFTLCIFLFAGTPTFSQSSNGNNTLQNNTSEGGSFGNGGQIDNPGSFDPTPVDPTPDPLDPATDPGGPGGDIDDIDPVPFDTGVVLLLGIALVFGYYSINQNQLRKNKVA
ncbi:MAG: hypothetical protein V9E96_21150 [Chitinophagaceae bacterium]|jgi:hypothetical protein|nr:hypothetical protein [Chitinophagaceae bacterium]MBP9739643.1 hypothetical protein [Chitinophagaceae bacterium]